MICLGCQTYLARGEIVPHWQEFFGRVQPPFTVTNKAGHSNAIFGIMAAYFVNEPLKEKVKV